MSLALSCDVIVVGGGAAGTAAAIGAASAGLNSRVSESMACSTSIARPLTFFVPNSSGNLFSMSSRIIA